MADEEILIITGSMIGDVVLTTGVIDRIVRDRPDARFTLVCSPATAILFRHPPAQATTIPLVKKPRGGHWFDLYRTLGGRRWAAIYDFRRTGFSRLLKGPKAYPRRQADAVVHKAREAATILGADTAPLDPVIWLDEAARADVPEALQDASRPLLALGPGASRLGKTWPVERFTEIARRLTAPGGRLENGHVAVVGGPMDKAASDAIASGLDAPGRFVDMAGADLLKTSAALSRAALFIGNDSGMMHLAAASGAPTLGLFGPTDERLYGPWGTRAKAVRPQGVDFAFGKTSRTVRTDETQMDALTVDAVEAAAHDLLSLA